MKFELGITNRYLVKRFDDYFVLVFINIRLSYDHMQIVVSPVFSFKVVQLTLFQFFSKFIG